MHKSFLLFLFLLVFNTAFADTYVQGHTTKNGTYVQPHYRSDANNTTLDNWSTKGNTNPYTGQEGTKSYNYNPPSTYQSPKPYQYKNPYDLNSN